MIWPGMEPNHYARSNCYCCSNRKPQAAIEFVVYCDVFYLPVEPQRTLTQSIEHPTTTLWAQLTFSAFGLRSKLYRITRHRNAIDSLG